jgi:predicted O-methyltransferase YrrM
VIDAAGARRLAGHVYRRCAAPLGLRALDRMLRNGLPRRFETPIRFLFTGELEPEVRAVGASIERRRQAVAEMPERYVFSYATSPHGPTRWPVRETAGSTRAPITGGRLAHGAAVPERWGLFLHLCAEAAATGTMIELGSSTGISGAYLASGRGCRSLMTLEGSPDLALVAQATMDELAPGARVIQGPFDEGLDRAFAILDETRTGIDLAYLDGDHDETATVHYVQRLLPRLRPGAVIILDDIYLYADMWRAWHRIRTMPGMSVAINLGRFGLLTWKDGDGAPASFDLSRYTGWWRVGGSRRAAMQAS